MDAWSIIINIFLGGVLFFGNGFLGKLQYNMEWNIFAYGKFTFSSSENHDFSGNFFLKIVNPSIFLALVAVLGQWLECEAIISSFWLLVPCYWLWRLAFIIFRNLFVFLNLKYEGIACAISIILSESIFFAIIKPLLAQNESLWISSTELRDGVWFAIITYIAVTAWNIMKKSFSEQVLYPDEKKEALIWKRYGLFEKRYGKYVNTELLKKYESKANKNELLKITCVLYAIMIYEDYNRPKLIRALEYVFKFFLPKKTMSLGIMQVRSPKIISNKKSISLALSSIISQFNTSNDTPEQKAISKHNPDDEYFMEVFSIYYILISKFMEDYSADVSNEDIESYMI